MNTDGDRLVTRTEWDALPPIAQGFVLYMQAARPGSELAGVKCPYAPGTSERREWDRGEFEAIDLCQDLEDC